MNKDKRLSSKKSCDSCKTRRSEGTLDIFNGSTACRLGWQRQKQSLKLHKNESWSKTRRLRSWKTRSGQQHTGKGVRSRRPMKKGTKQTQMLQELQQFEGQQTRRCSGTGAELMKEKRRRMSEELEVEVTVGPRERLACIINLASQRSAKQTQTCACGPRKRKMSSSPWMWRIRQLWDSSLCLFLSAVTAIFPCKQEW